MTVSQHGSGSGLARHRQGDTVWNSDGPVYQRLLAATDFNVLSRGAMGIRITLKQKCRHFDETFITGCTGSCHFDNFQCSQWWTFHQNEDSSVSVCMTEPNRGDSCLRTTTNTKRMPGLMLMNHEIFPDKNSLLHRIWNVAILTKISSHDALDVPIQSMKLISFKSKIWMRDLTTC